MLILFTTYWKGNGKKRAFLYLLALLKMGALGIAGTVYLNSWRNDFYNSLSNHSIAAFWPLILKFTLVASGLVLIYAYTNYLSQLMSLDWRLSLTHYFENKWLTHKSTNGIDNPDQRISEDINKFVNNIVLLGGQFLNQMVFLVIFSIITFKLSGALFHTSGLLLWVSLGYALIGSLATWFLGKPLVNIEFETQKREADYRFGLAMERGIKSNIELSSHSARLDELKTILLESFSRQKLVNFFVSSYNQLEVVIPFLFIAPSYFASILTLGWLMQTAQAMNMVQQSVSYIVNNYSEIAKLKATVDRLVIFNKQLEV